MATTLLSNAVVAPLCAQQLSSPSPAPRRANQATLTSSLKSSRAVSRQWMSATSAYFGTPARLVQKAGGCKGTAKRTTTVRAAASGTERTYVMVKPDGVQRGVVGDIISRFERKGFALKALKLYQTPEDLAKEHYKDLASKPFYGKLVEYIVSGPVVSMVWEGAGVVASARKLIGATNPLTAEPGTIRGDLAVEVGRNVVHGSDSPENAEREIELWFKNGEVVDWTQTMTPWLRE